MNRPGITLSARTRSEPPNWLAEAKSAAALSGVKLTDLTDSNPTDHGLTDPAIIDVLARHLYEARRYRPDPRGWLPARQALADRFGGVPDDYWLTASTSEAYSWLFTVMADPGDAVVAPAPGYPLVEPLARFAGLNVVSYSSFYLHPHGWELDMPSLTRWLGGRPPAAVWKLLGERSVRAVVAVNPNNPTGAYIAPTDAARLGAACASAGVPIIADEVFFPFVLDGVAPHRVADSAGPHAVVATLDGLSKLLAAPQLKLGWIRLSGPPSQTAALARALETVADAYLSVNSPAACALPALLELADASAERIRARCAANLATLRGLGDACRVRRTDGGWTALVDVPRLTDDDGLARRLLTKGLIAHPGWFYDLPDEGCLAVSLLPKPSRFQQMARRVKSVVDGSGIEFVRAVWNSLDHSRLPIADDYKQMIDRALADLTANPRSAITAAKSVARLRQITA